jgi:hypothetical protein
MDQNTFMIIGPLALAALGTLAWFLFQRQIKRSDEADAKEKSEAEARTAELEERVRKLEIDVERRVTREELKELRAEFKADMQASALQIIAALKPGHGS